MLPAWNPHPSNTINVIPPSALFGIHNGDQGPLVEALYTRMIVRSPTEEGTVDIVNHISSNDFARCTTAYLLEDTRRAQNFIRMQINTNADKISSPFLNSKYDYHFSNNFD